MKIKILSAICLAASLISSRAASVLLTDALVAADTANYHYTDSSHLFVTLKSSNGNTLGNGMKVRIGYFVGYDSNLDAKLRTSDFVTLLDPQNANRFVPLGEGTTGDGLGGNNTANLLTKTLGGVDGRVVTNMANINYNTGTANALGASGVNRGTKLFVLLYNQSDTTIGSSTEIGLYSAINWLIPDTGTATTQVSLKDIDTAGEVYRGSLGSLVTATTVPEPALTTLFLVGLSMGFRRKR